MRTIIEIGFFIYVITICYIINKINQAAVLLLSKLLNTKIEYIPRRRSLTKLSGYWYVNENIALTIFVNIVQLLLSFLIVLITILPVIALVSRYK